MDPMELNKISEMLGPPRGDKPRKIVVCHPDIYPEVQKGVAELGHNDVLVQPNRHIPDAETVYVIDAKALDFDMPFESVRPSSFDDSRTAEGPS